MKKDPQLCIDICLLVYTIILLAESATTTCDCCTHLGSLIQCRNVCLDKIPSPPPRGVNTSKGWCSFYGGYTDWWRINGDDIRVIQVNGSRMSEFNTGEVFVHYKYTESIECDNCKFQQLGENAFWLPGTVSHVKNISLRSNSISEIHPRAFAGLSSLEKLDLTGNKIASLPDDVFDFLGNLTELYLSRNLLSSLNPRWFLKLEKLKILSVESNQLGSLPEMPNSLLGLNELLLKKNHITSIGRDTLKNLHKLCKLNLKNNSIATIDPFAFENNNALGFVDLSGNKLTQLGRCTFVGLKTINFIDISYNQLTTAHYEWFANSIHHCDQTDHCQKGAPYDPVTRGNPWVCDCRMKDYAVFLHSLDYTLIGQNWRKYLGIKCPNGQLVSGTGHVLIESCFNSSVEEHELSKASRNKTCHPMCPFMKIAHCPAPHEEGALLAVGKPAFLSVVGIATFAGVSLCFVFLFRTKNRRQKRRPSDSSDDGSGKKSPRMSESDSSTSTYSLQSVETDSSTPNRGRRGPGDGSSTGGSTLQHQRTDPHPSPTPSGPDPNSSTPSLNPSETRPKMPFGPNSPTPSLNPSETIPKMPGNNSQTEPKTIWSTEETRPKEVYDPNETVPKSPIETPKRKGNSYAPAPTTRTESEYTEMKPLVPRPNARTHPTFSTPTQLAPNPIPPPPAQPLPSSALPHPLYGNINPFVFRPRPSPPNVPAPVLPPPNSVPPHRNLGDPQNANHPVSRPQLSPPTLPPPNAPPQAPHPTSTQPQIDQPVPVIMFLHPDSIRPLCWPPTQPMQVPVWDGNGKGVPMFPPQGAHNMQSSESSDAIEPFVPDRASKAPKRMRPKSDEFPLLDTENKPKKKDKKNKKKSK